MNGGSGAAEIRVICGPTGAGKSALAMRRALVSPHERVVIVSADSRQVYRGFDIGTAKPSAAERASVRHVGVDVADPTERYSAARWALDADRWIADAVAAGETPVVVGGTGLYLRALFEGLFLEPPLDPARRAAIESFAATQPTPELRRWIERLDPDRAHLGRSQLLRALEVALLAGRRISDLHRDAHVAPRWRPRFLLVDPGPELAAWNGARIDAMFAAGWMHEVARLAAGVPEAAPAWKSTGYRTMRRLACGHLEPEAAREAILIETRQYVKRQRTWFRHQLDPRLVTPFDPTRDSERAFHAWWTPATGD